MTLGFLFIYVASSELCMHCGSIAIAIGPEKMRRWDHIVIIPQRLLSHPICATGSSLSYTQRSRVMPDRPAQTLISEKTALTGAVRFYAQLDMMAMVSVALAGEGATARSAGQGSSRL